jgi:hypothetical protein
LHSAPPEAYMIEDGKITYPVKAQPLIGNGPDVLTRVEVTLCRLIPRQALAAKKAKARRCRGKCDVLKDFAG